MSGGPVFERWSVERYRAEMGLPPAGSPAKAAPRAQAARVRGGTLTGLPSSGTDWLLPSAEEPAPRAKKRKKKLGLLSGHPSEEQIHRACADWVFALELRYPILRWFMHVPNGGHRSVGEAGKMKAMGVRKGVVDWIHPLPSPSGFYKGLAIELKSHDGELSQDQEDFLHDVGEAGWLTAVCRSSEHFIEVVETWLSR